MLKYHKLNELKSTRKKQLPENISFIIKLIISRNKINSIYYK